MITPQWPTGEPACVDPQTVSRAIESVRRTGIPFADGCRSMRRAVEVLARRQARQ